MAKSNQKQKKSELHIPVVTIMGHVDHGKTSLLDYIRSTNVAGKEFGGITQHIGAYQAEVKGKEVRKITFIDTPGHQAFSQMRSRGAAVADIAVLVVAANDGVMPQTIESLEIIKQAKLPFIVVVNKIDLPDFNLDRIKKQLTKNGVNLEEYGGDTPLVPLSAKTGKGVDKLLEMILLVYDLYGNKEENPHFLGVVIESMLSRNRGAVATVIVRSGSVKIGDIVALENQQFKLRALIDWVGKNLESANAGTPVEILGWQTVPQVGAALYKSDERTLTTVSQSVSQTGNNIMGHNNSLPDISSEGKNIKFILKSDTAGTLEAILASLKSNNNIQIVQQGTGAITESDVLFAKTTKSIIIGFNVKVPDNVSKLAMAEKVIIKTYHIIYELIDEITEVVDAALRGDLVNILGTAKVQALFPIKEQLIAGIKVLEGRISRGDQVKIVRGEQELGRARIKSLKHGKEDINTASEGTEAGVLLSQNISLLTGDSIISIG